MDAGGWNMKISIKYGKIVADRKGIRCVFLSLVAPGIYLENRTMSAESVASTKRVNLEQCIYCTHYEALGCGGGTRFCMRHDVFLMHDPACEEKCPDRSPVEGAC